MHRFEREKKTLTAMIALYCRDQHQPPEGLCADCAALQEYARARLERCTFGADKPKCAACPVHCYQPAMRAAIRAVMSYAGPRMLVRHPVLAMGHAVDGLRHRPAKGRGQKSKVRDQKAADRRPDEIGDATQPSSSETRAMTTTPDTADTKLLVALQKGLPLDPRPFARIGSDVGLSEETVLATVRALFETGVARRFGAVFDSRSLGYESTLCAADVPTADLESAVDRIVPHPGITHCYEREGHPNLWFTMTAPAAELKPEIARVFAALGPYGVLNLPALRKFKIEAVFGQNEEAEDAAAEARHPPKNQEELLTTGGRASSRAAAQQAAIPAAPLTERERQVVRRLQASIPVSADPFGNLARELGYDPAELLVLLQRWEQTGVIRRIGLVLRHRQLGFSANSMCVWAVAPDRIETAGASLARSKHVTHCYERPSFASFPFNLYAMIHAKSREEAVGIFQQLGTDAGLSEGRMLWSVREFKKSSPVFFCERTGILFATSGTTCRTAMGVYDQISHAASLRFPGVEPRWCYTSAPVRRKLAAQGLPAPGPMEALAAMQTDGFTRVAVLPLHLSDGMEFGELAETVADWAHRPGITLKLALGHALLTSEADWRRAIEVLLAALPEAPGEHDRIILVAHGSKDPQGSKTLLRAAEICRTVDSRIILGMLLGKPDLDDVVRECRSAGVQKAWLLPCMVVAGYSAKDEIAGTGEQSWSNTLQRAGIDTVAAIKGLGEVNGIVQIWLDAVERMLAELTKS